jgi:hypothetical protein
MKKSNEQLFEEIREVNVITEQQISLLKRRKNRGEVIDVEYLIDNTEDGCGIPVTYEQGLKGLKWLQKWSRSRKYPFADTLKSVVAEFTAADFTFNGFYDAGNAFRSWYMPIYQIGNLEYTIVNCEPYILSY